jgi:hypothetical protein
MMLAAAACAHLPASRRSHHSQSKSFNRALAVGCTHCHVEGQWRDPSKRPFAIAMKMQQMVDVVNAKLEDRSGISCVTCHGGQLRPVRQPREALDAQLARWPADLAAAPDQLKITMAVYNVALGVGCDHCHTSDWADRSKEAIRVVPLMNSLFQEFPKYMPAGARTQCFMCHKGSIRPARPSR